MDILSFLREPWPWYVAGPLIGLFVPALLIAGNKTLGISSTFRDICAAVLPANIEFLKYDWRAERWNLTFVLGIFLGGFLTALLLSEPGYTVGISEKTQTVLASQGVALQGGLAPQLLSWEGLFTLRGFILIIVGGFLVGFGTRYAGGCTSGHAIMGISALQWTSLVATCCFFAGGLLMTHFLLPFLLTL